MSTSSTPLRLGILSTARIAAQFFSGISDCAAVRVEAIASRDPSQAERFATRLGIPRVHPTYSALLADPALDAVYLPLPNAFHTPWCERALRAGKHVLCEKPLTQTLAEARQLFATAQACGRVLLEAWPYRFQPLTLRLLELLASGAIGRLRLLQSYFGFPLDRPDDIRLDASLGGGALLDVGCYAVSLARLLTGVRPSRVQAWARSAASGVDLACHGTLEYPDGTIAQIGCAFDAALLRTATLIGTRGVIETDFANHSTDHGRGVLRLRRSSGWNEAFETIDSIRGNGFAFEAAHFAALIRGSVVDPGVGPDSDIQRSLDNAATLEALGTSWRNGGQAVTLVTAE